MSSQKPNPSLHDLLLSSWRHDQENACDSDYPSLPPKVLCYSDGPASSTAQQDNRSKIRQQLLENCEQYVLNYLPTHLLRIDDMALVTRTEFWEAERDRIERKLQDDIHKFTVPKQSNGTGNPSHDKWHLRARGDEIAELRQDAYIRKLFRFAIFSHRWGDDEPLFRDILDKRPTENPTIGYEKLLKFCQRASTDYGCRYVWSDTCCINKESSVELDEAIRSMYRWYSIATVCIVHLAQSLTVGDFELEPWFKRGWTLQELLAPQVIRFYGKDWKPICQERNNQGDKATKEIWSAIEVVTGISHDDLWHFLPSCDRVAEKMTWASKRKTTKIEDAAYSLLGLFNVSLPIAYGEADKAWYRLMAVIANECTDASFFAWAGRPSPYSRALPSSPKSYSKLDPRIPARLFNRRHPSYEVTKLGVVIKMLVIPARCNVLEDNDGRDIGYTVTPHNLESFLVGADVPHGRVEEYGLGIVNFCSRGDVVLVEAEDECHCLVLARERPNDQGWTLVNTECVVVVRCLEEILVYGSLNNRALSEHNIQTSVRPIVETTREEGEEAADSVVQTAAAQYSNIRGVRRLREYSLVRLEIELQSIASACRAILEILNNPFLSCQHRLDDRLMDWLSDAEPETCLATLEAMEKLLKVDRRVQPFSELAPTKSGCPENETFEAVVTHFYASKAHFHFLLTTNIWNYETGGLGRNLLVNVNNSVDEIIQDNHQLQFIAKNCMVDEDESRRKRESVSQKLDKFLHFLDGLDCTAKQKETTSLRQSDTCMWLRYTNEYKSWKGGGDSFLLLQGKAGAGKSVLAYVAVCTYYPTKAVNHPHSSSVINDLLDTIHEDEFLLYFYCDFRTKRSTSAVEVMRSILAQLLSHLCVVMVDPEGLLDDLLRETNNRVEPFYNVKGLSHHLSKIAKLCRRKPFVVIDCH
ncbi:hypothetical protein J3R83DRAFT_3273 [Lanmaoa asiatica]|nr:hypothetical protein J3R83DRAFT_3273 [Lanmaoa asiatica]